MSPKKMTHYCNVNFFQTLGTSVLEVVRISVCGACSKVEYVANKLGIVRKRLVSTVSDLTNEMRFLETVGKRQKEGRGQGAKRNGRR